MPDPVIQTAIREIQAVLHKHDLAAFVLVSSPTHTQYLIALEASWHVVREEGHGIRLRCKAADFPSPEAHKRALTASVGLIAGFADCARDQAEKLTELLAMIGSQVAFGHISREERPDAFPGAPGDPPVI